MNGTKTIILIKTLSKKDCEALVFELKANKRKTLLDLFNASLKIIKNEKNLDVKSFFELFYKKKYSIKEDNLFRNELRLLNTVIENYIVGIQIEKTLKNDYYFKKKYYLEYLLVQESFSLLEKELSKVMKQIEVNNDYIFFYDFYSIWTRLQTKNIKIELKYLEEVKEKYQVYFQNWLIEIGIKTKKLEVFKAFVDRFSFVVNRNVEFDSDIESIALENDNIYFNYLKNKAKSYKLQGEEKIALLNAMLIQLDEIKTSDLNKESEKFILYQSLGVEKMLQAENLIAANYFAESLKNIETIDDKIIIKGLYNFISTLIKLEDFDTAIELFETHQNKIIKSNINDLFSCIVTMCYIFAGKIENAESINRIIDSNKSVGNFLYSRCNLAIIHFVNNEAELAQNELININQSINYHKNQDQAYLDFASIFKSYIQLSYSTLLLKSNIPKLKEMEKKLLENSKKSNVSYGGDSLHLFWLLKQIQSNLIS